MKTKIWLCSFLILSFTATRAEQLTLSSGDGSSAAARVAQLVAAGDFPGIARVSDEIESQAKGVHDVAYFRDLLGVLSSLERSAGSERSYAHLWAIRKIQWKIVLTKHSDPGYAGAILKIKDAVLRIGLSRGGVSQFADDDQFVALRLDAANLLWSYRDCLQQWIIPNYIQKRERGMGGNGFPPSPLYSPAPLFPTESSRATADAERKQQEAEWTQNRCENYEQIYLNNALRQLDGIASLFIIREFTWPPEDDATVTKLLDTFPPHMLSREQMLEKVAAMQQSNLQEHEKLNEKAAAALRMPGECLPGRWP